jgi:hypothetical protein
LAGDVQSRFLLQESPVAGFRYYEGKAVWDGMQVGDTLTLVREPDNPYDPNAVRVEWRGHKVGYVPRTDNEALARFLDQGMRAEAKIVRLKKARNPRQRVLFEVLLEVQRQPL